MARSDQWRTRLQHESQMHERSSFVTLTFSDEHLPTDYSVNVRDLQLFMKRLRKSHGKCRYFACGEYGDRTLRPHYHMIIFGLDFTDQVPWRKSGSGHVLYRSESLERLWPFGHSEVGTVTPQSCGYVARYCLKKVNGPRAADHYTRLNPLTGELHQVRPEFVVMSQRPGIGADWYDQFSCDVFPSDFVIIEGQKRAIPRYYTKKLKAQAAEAAYQVKLKRMETARQSAADNTPERLAVREELQHIRVDRLVRPLDGESQ